jgi:hypothetical protein
MTRKLLLAVTVAVAMAVLPGLLLPVPAQARSKCQYFSDGREPRCHVVSDGAREPYVDDRKHGTSFTNSPQWQRYRESVRRRQQFREGREHTQDMATGGTMHGNLLVSPFVPGSTADKGWQAERKRRGQCGNDRLCLNQ